MKKSTLAIFALIISQLFWGGSYILTDAALQVFPPAMVVTMRILIAIVILGAIGFATGQITKVAWKDYKYFFIAALCEPFIYFICEAEALVRVSPTMASVILSFIPLLMPVFAFAFLREKITFTNVFGIVISVVGVMMIILQGGKLSVSLAGLALLFCSVFASITYTMMMRTIPDTYNTLTIVFWMFCTSMLFFVPTTFIREWTVMSAIDYSAPETFSAFGSVVGLSISASCIAFLFFSFGIRTIGATKANAYNNIQPGVTAILSWILLGEHLAIVKIFGIVVVVVGMFISQMDMGGFIEKTKKMIGIKD